MRAAGKEREIATFDFRYKLDYDTLQIRLQQLPQQHHFEKSG